MPTLEVTWLDSRETVSLPELSRACGMSMDELAELVEYGALVPLAPTGRESLFSASCVVPLRTVSKLCMDFDLDVFTAAVLMGYLDRIDELERQVLSLQATGAARPGQTQHSEGDTS